MNSRNLIIGILFILVVGGLVLYLQYAEYDVDVKIDETVQKFYSTILNNGLTVTVKEVHTLPLVSIQFWVKTGSLNEDDVNRGIAHIFEHIWFKGTEKQPAGVFDNTISSSGGYVNAMTSQDYTAFYLIIPTEKFEETLELMTDLFKNQIFDPKEIELEKGVILEEQRMIKNEPSMLADEEFGLTLFKEHPYRHPIIGYEETISAANPSSIKEFYQTWHVPNNMNLVVVGDITNSRVLQAARNLLEDIPRKELPALDIPAEPEQKGIRFEIKTKKGLENSYVALGYRTCGFRDKNWYALRVLTQILDGAENSRIQRIVKTQKELVSKSDSFYVPLVETGAIETLLVVAPELEQEAIQAVLEEYTKFKKEYVTDSELESAKKQLQAGYAQQQEEIVEQGKSIGRWWIAGIISDQPYYLRDIFAVSKADIFRVAKEYFENPVIVVLRPE